MKLTDIASMMRDIAPVIREFTEASIAPFKAKIAELEKSLADVQAVAANEDAQAILAEVDDRIRRAVSNLPPAVGVADGFINRDNELVLVLTDGKSIKLGVVVGKDADNREIKQALCAELDDKIEALKAEVDQARKSIPTFELPDVDAKIAEAVEALKDLRTEKGLSVEDVLPLIDKRVAAAFAERPQPQDGKSVSIEDVLPVIKTEVASAVEQIPKPRDGRDGRDGKDGKDADMPALERMITDSCKAIQDKVKDGKDGLGFDDMDVETTEEGVFLTFTKGDEQKRFHLPLTTDCGVYSPGRNYLKGNGVTFGGSFWIAQKETSDKPGESDAWRLAVKRGRDGKDSK